MILKTAVEHSKIPFALRLSKGKRDFGITKWRSVPKPFAVDDHVRSIQVDCLKLVSDMQNAAPRCGCNTSMRAANTPRSTPEAKVRLEAGDAKGALAILDKAEQNGCADEYTQSIRASVLKYQERSSVDLKMA